MSVSRRFVSEAEMAQLVAKSPATLKRLRAIGKAPPWYRIGGSVRYDLDQFEEFLAKNGRQNPKGNV